jgi:hypothetical protein
VPGSKPEHICPWRFAGGKRFIAYHEKKIHKKTKAERKDMQGQEKL